DRFWRWKDFPLPDSPSAISPVSTDSRFATPSSLTPTPLPAPLVNFQAVPTAPGFTANAAALELLGTEVFKDLTGLTANQKNAMAAFTSAMGASESFGSEAFQLAMAKDAARNLDRTLDQIKAAKGAGLLTNEEASKATRDALLRSIGQTASAPSTDITSVPQVGDAIEKAAATSGGSAKIMREQGDTSESVSFNVKESALTVGAATARVMDYPVEIWVEVPIVKDSIESTTLDFSDTVHAQK